MMPSYHCKCSFTHDERRLPVRHPYPPARIGGLPGPFPSEQYKAAVRARSAALNAEYDSEEEFEEITGEAGDAGGAIPVSTILAGSPRELRSAAPGPKSPELGPRFSFR
jgi:hypothetical protein